MLRTSGAVNVDELLFDPVTSLPGLRVLVPQIEQALGDRGAIGLLAVNIARFSKLEQIYGWETFDEFVRGFASCLQAIKDESLRKSDTLAELSVNGSVFVLMLSPPRLRKSLGYRDLERIKQRITAQLDRYLERTLSADLRYRFQYFIGCALLKREPSVRLERQIYRTIDEALSDASSERERAVRERARGVRNILRGRKVRTVYQPIVNLLGREVVGYEALSRGPRGVFESPEVLFRAAYEAELVFELDRLCQERALVGCRHLVGEQLLFINIEPLTIFDPALMARVPQRYRSRVVFEITERAAVKDFNTFRGATQLVKAGGFRLALDDVGSAYSGLRLVSEVEPDFIKLDMELTRGAHKSKVKMELVRAVSSFCGEAGMPLIAEGVECAEELEALGTLGVPLVQGHYLGRPDAMPKRPARVAAAAAAALS